MKQDFFSSYDRHLDSDVGMSSSSEKGDESVQIQMSSEDDQALSQENSLDSEAEVIGNISESDDEWRSIGISFRDADSLCKRLDGLIQSGRIPKDKNFYKYLTDVVEIMYNPLHRYDDDVKEFFQTLTYHGGNRTYNMVRGAMGIRQGHSNCSKSRMNLGGPSQETLRKGQAAFTTESGVIKHLCLRNYKLLKCSSSSSQTSALVSDDNLVAYPFMLGNDGTALKPAMQFDERNKVNVGLIKKVSLDFVKENAFLSKETLQAQLVCEAMVSSVTSLDNNSSLPIAVNYVAKKGKTGDELKKMLVSKLDCYRCVRTALHMPELWK